MKNILLNVYDEKENIVKQCICAPVKIKFGTIRKIMELLKIEQIEDTFELLEMLYNAWDSITSVLSSCFPDMEEEDWDNVPIEEVVPAIVEIAKYSMKTMLALPKNPKN